MEEVWKDVVGYEGLYKVSNDGRILKIIKNKLINLKVCKEGYYRVSLLKNKTSKNFYVHRLVALTFLDNPENKPTVNHIDGDKLNNCVKNLEWATYKENNKHARDNGLLNIKEKMCCKLDENKNILEIYTSINEASIINNLRATYVSGSCHGIRSHANNIFFRFYDKPNNCFIKTKFDETNYQWTSGVKKSIKCIELDIVFESIKEASNKLNISKSGIHSVLKGRQNKVSGLTFKYFKTILTKELKIGAEDG